MDPTYQGGPLPPKPKLVRQGRRPRHQPSRVRLLRVELVEVYAAEVTDPHSGEVVAFEDKHREPIAALDNLVLSDDWCSLFALRQRIVDGYLIAGATLVDVLVRVGGGTVFEREVPVNTTMAVRRLNTLDRLRVVYRVDTVNPTLLPSPAAAVFAAAPCPIGEARDVPRRKKMPPPTTSSH